MTNQAIDQLVLSVGCQRLPSASTCTVFIIDSHNDPAKCARIEAEMQLRGYSAIVVTEAQYAELASAGFNSDLMNVVTGEFHATGIDYLGGIIPSPDNRPWPKKKRPIQQHSSLRNRWGQIR
ncbi:hypothetical protein [Pseudomonas costantinii]|uniref:Uncharacterized protein n=1 Tax=Pseudomonas costantinii TaxID=168469 RepID=A0A1S2UDN2_9PSED|nr:hypothetical protein [Pseudomonas costantinii]OIN44531.1 hypothetical protein BFL40_30045 [Pseudomonas costantinii]SED26932.1 hypothetical protein SAMN04515675_0502 [Pseudomonas costantinii]